MFALTPRHSSTGFTLLELIASFGLQAERRWADVAVVEGGPVDEQQAMVLHAPHPSLPGSTEIVPGVGLTGAMELFQAAAEGDAPQHVIAALGYSGWGAGQLEQAPPPNRVIGACHPNHRRAPGGHRHALPGQAGTRLTSAYEGERRICSRV